MSSSPLIVRKVAVLGAGVMGAQIAAHLVNANVPVVLFDLPAKEGNPNGIVQKALAGLAKLEPAPLGVAERIAHIEAANYGADLARLADCDLVIEAIAERIDWKRDLYTKIAPHLAPHAILATNTSGLPLATLSAQLPADLARRFCGVHFFNPPRYMHLVELIGGPATEPGLLDGLEAFLTTALGKGVLRAKDTPNFIANRIGVFSIVATMIQTERFGLGFDVVDALTGPAIGRPKSASFRTVDVVGLDTTAHVIGTMRDTLPDDPWHAHFNTPPVLAALVAKGALGQKAKAGFYRKQGKEIQVLDPRAGDYRASAAEVAPEVAEILKIRAPGEKLAKLRASSHPQAQFLWAIFRDVFHYCAYHLAAIADNARDVDLGIRWGFGWQSGPFETWQAAGWSEVAGWIAEDIAAGKALANAPLPAWVSGTKVAEAKGVHGPGGAYSPVADAFHPRSSLPVYRRQLFPDAVLTERFPTGNTVFETDAVRLWHMDDDIGILSFRTKGHTVSEAVLDGVLRAVDDAERRFAGLVLWQTKEPFSFGADLGGIQPAIQAGQWGAIESVVAKFQQAAMRLKYSQVPTVAAVRGMALGGSCEFILHATRAVAALESYIGLVEVGVGLLPAGGGCKELAVRSADEMKRGAAGSQIDVLPFIRAYFQTIAMATVSRSAQHARELRLPATGGHRRDQRMGTAARRQRAGACAGRRRPPAAAACAQRSGCRQDGHRDVADDARQHARGWLHQRVRLRDRAQGRAGDVRRRARAGSLVDERWFLELERAEFMNLLRNEKTQQRIVHTLQTGKPLRN